MFDPLTYLWLKSNLPAYDNSKFLRTMIEDKTKELFRQMDIEYYGEDNDAIGTLSATEEFYIRLKIFNSEISTNIIRESSKMLIFFGHISSTNQKVYLRFPQI